MLVPCSTSSTEAPTCAGTRLELSPPASTCDIGLALPGGKMHSLSQALSK